MDERWAWGPCHPGRRAGSAAAVLGSTRCRPRAGPLCAALARRAAASSRDRRVPCLLCTACVSRSQTLPPRGGRGAEAGWRLPVPHELAEKTGALTAGDSGRCPTGSHGGARRSRCEGSAAARRCAGPLTRAAMSPALCPGPRGPPGPRSKETNPESSAHTGGEAGGLSRVAPSAGTRREDAALRGEACARPRLPCHARAPLARAVALGPEHRVPVPYPWHEAPGGAAQCPPFSAGDTLRDPCGPVRPARAP